MALDHPLVPFVGAGVDPAVTMLGIDPTAEELGDGLRFDIDR